MVKNYFLSFKHILIGYVTEENIMLKINFFFIKAYSYMLYVESGYSISLHLKYVIFNR